MLDVRPVRVRPRVARDRTSRYHSPRDDALVLAARPNARTGARVNEVAHGLLLEPSPISVDRGRLAALGGGLKLGLTLDNREEHPGDSTAPLRAGRTTAPIPKLRLRARVGNSRETVCEN